MASPLRIDHPGLCRTCSFQVDCTFPRIDGRSVTECLEFSGIQPVDPPRPARPRVAAAGEGRGGAPVGLCSTCDRRHDCTFPKPESGVWFCEEYA
jgi:hypothetical protein